MSTEHVASADRTPPLPPKFSSLCPTGAPGVFVALMADGSLQLLRVELGLEEPTYRLSELIYEP